LGYLEALEYLEILEVLEVLEVKTGHNGDGRILLDRLVALGASTYSLRWKLLLRKRGGLPAGRPARAAITS
jgi:hypothetical protein